MISGLPCCFASALICIKLNKLQDKRDVSYKFGTLFTICTNRLSTKSLFVWDFLSSRILMAKDKLKKNGYICISSDKICFSSKCPLYRRNCRNSVTFHIYKSSTVLENSAETQDLKLINCSFISEINTLIGLLNACSPTVFDLPYTFQYCLK